MIDYHDTQARRVWRMVQAIFLFALIVVPTAAVAWRLLTGS